MLPSFVFEPLGRVCLALPERLPSHRTPMKPCYLYRWTMLYMYGFPVPTRCTCTCAYVSDPIVSHKAKIEMPCACRKHPLRIPVELIAEFLQGAPRKPAPGRSNARSVLLRWGRTKVFQHAVRLRRGNIQIPRGVIGSLVTRP